MTYSCGTLKLPLVIRTAAVHAARIMYPLEGDGEASGLFDLTDLITHTWKCD
jgi:hypothetical protein